MKAMQQSGEVSRSLSAPRTVRAHCPSSRENTAERREFTQKLTWSLFVSASDKRRANNKKRKKKKTSKELEFVQKKSELGDAVMQSGTDFKGMPVDLFIYLASFSVFF